MIPPHEQEQSHPLPLWVRWCIVLIVLLVVLAATIFWIIQGAQAVIPLAVLTALGILLTFFQLLPLLFPHGRQAHSIPTPSPQRPGDHSRTSSLPLPSRSPEHVGEAQALPLVPLLQDEPVIRGSVQEKPKVDWGEAPHADHFYGREKELTALQRWLVDDHCRLVAILGMGGIGKTSLAGILVDQVKEHYNYVFWRSFLNAPPLSSMLQECIQFVSDQQRTVLPEDVDRQISLLMEYLRTRRCLLVLDNVDSIVQGGSQAGQYREGYEGYGRLLQRIGESRHQSCLLVTSREKPKEVALLEGETAAIRSYHLAGLPPADGQDILKDKGLQGTERHWEALITHYEGNPLALKLVAQLIREIYGGEITAFLTEGEVFFRDVRDVLEQQVARLSALEEEIVYWFAIEREAISLGDLQEDLVHPVSKGELQEALQSLRRRQLVETSATGFTLHPVIMEYLAARFVDRVCEELRTETLVLFERHAVLLAQAKEYIRESQRRLILLPLVQRLLTLFGKEALEQRFQRLLATLRDQHDHHPSYTAGNVLNVLIQAGCALRGYDCSHLVVQQAYLQGVDLPEVNFAHADLATSVFTDLFGSIRCVAFSPHGDLLAAGTSTGEIRLWHAASGLPLQTVQGHTDRVLSVAFSPDGSTLASGSFDQTVRLWEVSSGQCLKTLQGHDNRVESVAFSPDGSTLASGSFDQTVRLWEASSGKLLKTLQGLTDRVRSIAFSPDGSTLASGSDDQMVHLWEVSSAQHFRAFQGHTSIVWSVAFSPDGSTVVSGSHDRTVRLWEASSGKLLKTLQGHDNQVRSIAFSPDGSTLASGSFDQTVRLWEVSSGKLLKALQGHADWVWSVAFSPDGSTLASGSDDRTVRLWEASSGQCLKTLQGYSDQVVSVTFSPDGKMVASGSDDRMVRLWEVSSGQCLKTLQGHTKAAWSVAFSPDGSTLASGSFDQTVRLWEVSSGKLLKTLQGHAEGLASVAFSPDGSTLASGGFDWTLRLWEVSSGQCLNTLQGHTRVVSSVAFSPDGSMLASGSNDRTIRLWEASSGKLLKTLQGHDNQVRSIAFSPDGSMLASGSDDQTVRLWEVSSGQCKTVLRHSHWVWSVAFSPDGKTVASGSYDGAIKLWDRQTSACLRTLRSDRPYERMNITQVQGLTEGQKVTLRSLGAIEEEGQEFV